VWAIDLAHCHQIGGFVKMGCGTCGSRGSSKKISGGNKDIAPHRTNVNFSVMGNYKYLKPNQINKRLEVFKRIYCPDCQDRYNCDFEMYNRCDKVSKGG